MRKTFSMGHSREKRYYLEGRKTNDNSDRSAFAKINLTLDVLDRREDGYHDIRSILQTVALRDDIELLLDTARAGASSVKRRASRWTKRIWPGVPLACSLTRSAASRTV